MSDEGSKDFTYTVESTDEETEIAFVVRSLRGRKITQEDFVDQIEEYLDVIYGRADQAPVH